MASRAQTASRIHGFDVVDFLAKAQVWFALLLLIGLPALFIGAGNTPVEDREASTPLLQVLNLIAFLPAVLFLVLRPLEVWRTITRGWAYSLLLLVAVASILWSVEPELSMRRISALIIEMLFVVHIATYFTVPQFIRQMALVFAVVAVLSLLSLGVPHLGITPDGVHAGKWRGILGDKNTFGLFCGTACLCFHTMAAMCAAKSRERLAWRALFAVTFVMLIFANARTPLIALVVALGAMWAYQLLYRPTRTQARFAFSLRMTAVWTTILSVVVLIPLSVATVLTLLGRNMTLTGRAKLWEYAISKGWDRPWLGAGFKAFWTDKLTFDLRVLHQYWASDGQELGLTSNSHNGYLDVWVELGFVGLVFIPIMFYLVFRWGRQAYARTGNPAFLWSIGAIAFSMIFYLTNGFAMRHGILSWFVVSYAFYSMAAYRGPPAGSST